MSTGTSSAASREFEIVALESRHLGPARDVYNHYVLHDTATFDEAPLDGPSFEALLRFQDPRHAAFALLEGGRFAGYAYLGPYKARSAYRFTSEVSIYLHPGSRGRGIGTRAVAFLEARARERGFHALIAGVTAENAGSLALFRRLGFAEAARFREVGFKSGRWLDVVYLEKLLTP